MSVSSMSSKQTSFVLIIFLFSPFALFGCGSGQKKTTTKPTSVNSSAGTNFSSDAAIPKMDTTDRGLSKDERGQFRDLVKSYQKGSKDGLSSGECSSLSGKFRSLADKYPKLIEARFNQAAVLHECGRVSEAKPIYEKILAAKKDHGEALNNLGVIKEDSGDKNGAHSLYGRGAAGVSSSAFNNVAIQQRELARNGDRRALKESVDNIHRALAVDSFNLDAYNTLATIVYDHSKTRSQLEIARLICVQAIKQHDAYAPIHNVLGAILLKQNEVTRALKAFRKAAAIDPSLTDAQMNIGAITLNFRDYISAEAAFKKVLSLNPDRLTKFDATIGLGVAYRGQKKYDQAMAQYTAAGKLDGSRSDIEYNRAILIQDYLFDAENMAKAISQLKEVEGLLNRFVSRSKNGEKVSDAKRRLSDIRELIPMLREQQQIMKEEAATAKTPAKS